MTDARTRYSVGFRYSDNGQQFDTEAKLTPNERDQAQALLNQLDRDGEITEAYIVEWTLVLPHENYMELLGEIKSIFNPLVDSDEGRETYPELAKLLA
jgi:hypothetical protein